MHSNALSAYETVSKMTMSGREIEAAVLTKAARKLKNCQENWGQENQEKQLDEALKYNQRIWSIFQDELMREDNPLPKKLRFNILRLSTFIDRRIFETMAEPSSTKLNIIIDINNNLAAALRTTPK